MNTVYKSVLYHLKGKNLKCLQNSSNKISLLWAPKLTYNSKKIGDEKFKENLLTLIVFRLIPLKCITIHKNKNTNNK